MNNNEITYVKSFKTSKEVVFSKIEEFIFIELKQKNKNKELLEKVKQDLEEIYIVLSPKLLNMYVVESKKATFFDKGTFISLGIEYLLNDKSLGVKDEKRKEIAENIKKLFQIL